MNVREPQVLKSCFGSVKPYTRHLTSCPYSVEDPEYNECNCPKWLYERRKGGERLRYSLVTPSWTEAVEKATEVLRGFDPEIEAARRMPAQVPRKKTSVLDAINLWLDRTRRQFGDHADIVKQYRSTFGWIDQQGRVHGTLLRFVAQYNHQHPDEPITTIDQMTPLICQEWRDSKSFVYGSAVTGHQRWGTIRSFFNFLFQLGVMPSNPVANIKAPAPSDKFANVPFSEDQYKCILDNADWYVDDRVADGEREVYCRRMHAFLELLRHTGMDLSDAVCFQPAYQLMDENVDGVIVPVVRYQRRKTDVEAVIPVTHELARLWRSVPLAPDSFPGMPFRYKEHLLKSDVHLWSRRIKALLKLSEITEVQLITKSGKPAVDSRGFPIMKETNAKMLRHTAAVGWLVAGHREETVARMLGHVSTDMIREHYGPWCKQRDAAHIREVLLVTKTTSTASAQRSHSRRHRTKVL
jgi:site-specific recombinase XerD